MRFDVHTHAFHPKIAHKAVAHLNDFYEVHCAGDGTVAHLLQREHAAGFDKCVVLCTATAPAQVIPANNYAIQLQREHEDILAFGSIHPGFANWEAELARMKKAGLRGIKLHPDFQGFCLPSLKICFETDEPALAERIRAALPHCDLIRFSDGNWYKLTPSGVTKETAIMRLCDHLGITPENIAAFGDDYADIGMLQLCGLGIAMGNAIPEVKAIADVVTGGNDTDGIALWLEEQLL